MTTPRARRFLADAAAVSPVIATILMVAIAVVLGASVFVLVSNLKDGQEARVPPRLQLLGEPASGGSEMLVRIIANSPDRKELSEYRFVVALPNATIINVDVQSNANFAAGTDTWYAVIDDTTAGAVITATQTVPGATVPNLRITFFDVSGDDAVNAFDQVRIAYDDSDADAAYADPLAKGEWNFVIVHKKSDGISGETTRQVG